MLYFLGVAEDKGKLVADEEANFIDPKGSMKRKLFYRSQGIHEEKIFGLGTRIQDFKIFRISPKRT